MKCPVGWILSRIWLLGFDEQVHHVTLLIICVNFIGFITISLFRLYWVRSLNFLSFFLWKLLYPHDYFSGLSSHLLARCVYWGRGPELHAPSQMWMQHWAQKGNGKYLPLNPHHFQTPFLRLCVSTTQTALSTPSTSALNFYNIFFWDTQQIFSTHLYPGNSYLFYLTWPWPSRLCVLFLMASCGVI